MNLGVRISYIVSVLLILMETTVRICIDTGGSAYPDAPNIKKGTQGRKRNAEPSSSSPAFPLFLVQESYFALPEGRGMICRKTCTQFLGSSTLPGFKLINYL